MSESERSRAHWASRVRKLHASHATSAERAHEGYASLVIACLEARGVSLHRWALEGDGTRAFTGWPTEGETPWVAWTEAAGWSVGLGEESFSADDVLPGPETAAAWIADALSGNALRSAPLPRPLRDPTPFADLPKHATEENYLFEAQLLGCSDRSDYAWVREVADHSV